MVTAFFAIMAVIGWGLFLCAAIGGNAIRDDLRRRIDGLNSECARRGQVIDYLAAENNRLRSGGNVVPLHRHPTAARILDTLASNEAKRALDNDARIHGWLDEKSETWRGDGAS